MLALAPFMILQLTRSFFFFFWCDWGLNLRPVYARQALYNLSYTYSFFALLILR